MAPKFEVCDHAEVAAPAPERPEQVRLGSFRDMTKGSVRRDDIGREHVIRGMAEGAAEPPEAGPECQSRNARRRVDPSRHREAKRLCLVIKVAQKRPTLNRSSTFPRPDLHGPHRGEVDHHTAVAQGASGDVVPSASYGDQEVVL
jgi:hypothetical protein